MSRALGDLAGYYDAGLSPIPDICYHKLRKSDNSKKAGDTAKFPGSVNEGSGSPMRDITNRPGVDKFMLICSDGVWEFISSQDSLELCTKLIQKNANECAEMLARESWDRWTKHMMGQVVDDITVLVVNFGD
jgi:serine/threonine protein phosphatase PrpC